MRLKLHQVELPLKNVFAISRGSMSLQKSVVVELLDQGESGFGEATQSKYYGHTAVSIAAALESLEPELEAWDFTTPETLWDFAHPRLLDNYFALSALDQAAHDLHGKLHRTAVYTQNQLTWTNIPQSSVTISIASITDMLHEMEEYAQWPILKVKLGTAHDTKIIESIRKNTDAVIRVDANCAWSVDEAIRKSHLFADLGVEFIEQPLPADASYRSKRVVFEESALPIIADESCRQESDVRECDGLFHGINVKLCKCGGLTPAFRMLREARLRGLRTMVGCMIESEVAISAAAHLAPLLDYVDLDGAVLLADQPANGVKVLSGNVSKPMGWGCGVTFDTKNDCIKAIVNNPTLR